jgi:hypothetical protein
MLFAGKVPMFGQHTQFPTTPKFVGRRKLAEQNRFFFTKTSSCKGNHPKID